MAEQPIPEPQPVPVHLHPHVKGELRGEELVITVTIGDWRGERLKCCRTAGLQKSRA